MATSVVEHAQDDREPTADDPPATCTPTGLGCELGATRPALYTDGITEARDGSGEQFGHERLRDCLARCAGRSADEIATEIIGAAREFADGISDDVAVIVLRVPDDLGEDPVERVAAATGVPVAELRLPEYPPRRAEATPDPAT